MSKERLGAAVIGMRMGRGHATGYVNHPKTDLVAICDKDAALLEERKKEFNVARAVTDYKELLDAKDIDVVSVATPDYFHAEQSIAFMKAGKDVICEKPLTLDVKEAKKIIKAVRETGRKFMVGQVCRYAPGFVMAKQMVERGEIGELFLAESEYAHTYRHARGVGDWRVDPRREPVIGGGCHAVDLLRWIAGDVEEVSAYANHKCLADWPLNDCTIAALKFGKGVIGKVMVSIGCVRPYTMRSVFYGTEGTIVCDNTSPQIQLCSQKSVGTGRPEFTSHPVNIASHNVSAEIAEFVDCILGDKPVLTNEIEGAKTVATCVAIVESAKRGKPVKVAKLLGDVV
ncbi:MAG: Gfo/Idh/MocA family oxidoreductase [Planctomycetota bacterium]